MQGGLRGARLVGGCAALALVASCGGGSGGGSTGGGSVTVTPAPTATSTATPTPSPSATATPTPTTTGAVASAVEANIPGVTNAVSEIQVSNRGLYILVDRPAGGSQMVKLHGDPTASNAWTVFVPDTNVDITDFAISNPYAEADRAIGFYYTGSRSSPFTQVWGSYAANNGGVSFRAEGIKTGVQFGTIERIAVGAVSGSAVATRSWIVERATLSPNPRRVFQEDGVYTSSNTIDDRFGTAATPTIAGADRIIAHPSDPNLYIALNDKLYVYSSSAQLRSYTFPDTNSFVDTMLWYQNDLYVGHGTGIFRIAAGGTTSRVATLSGPGAKFCISNGEMFLTTGEAINLQTSTRRDWVAKGNLSPAQSTQAQILRATLAGGLYCSGTATSTVIYTRSPTSVTGIRMITPVAP